MIVYNVQRRWFTLHNDAETYRKSLGLKPTATLAVVVNGRIDLAGLLNALCEPGPDTQAKMPDGMLIPEKVALVDRAYVDAQLTVPDCVPLFLIKDDEQRKAVALDRFARQTAP